MKKIIVIFSLKLLSITCFGQSKNIFLYPATPTFKSYIPNICLYDPDIDKILKGKVSVLLYFDNRESLTVIETKIGFIEIKDSITGEIYLDYPQYETNNTTYLFGDTLLDDLFKYEYGDPNIPDSIVENHDEKIIRKNYQNYSEPKKKKLNFTGEKKLNFYKMQIDSIFINLEYKISNENNPNFIPKMATVLIFKVYPLK